MSEAANIQIKINTSQAEKAERVLAALQNKSDKLYQSLSQLDKGTSFNRMDSAIKGTNTSLGKLKAANDSASSSIDKTTRSGSGLTSVMGKLRTAASLAVAALASNQILQSADAYKNMNARLLLATKSQEEFNTAQTELFNVAQNSRQQLAEVSGLYANISPALRELGKTQQEVLTSTDLINKALVVSGSTSQESSSAILQLTQALGSGVLRGEEFNSIMENGRGIAMALADGLGVPIGALRGMAEQGQLTADVVITALLSQEKAINEKFAQMPLTVDQAMTQVKNSLFQTIGQLEEKYGFSGKIAAGISSLTGVISQSVPYISAFVDTVSAGWDVIQPFAGSIATVAAAVGGSIGSWALLSGAVATVTGAFSAMSAVVLANPIVATVAAIAAAAYLIYDNWEPISGFFSDLWSDAEGAASNFLYWWENTTFSEKVVDVATYPLEFSRGIAEDFLYWWDGSDLKEWLAPVATDAVEWAWGYAEQFDAWWNSWTLEEVVADVTSDLIVWAWKTAADFDVWWNSWTLASIVAGADGSQIEALWQYAEKFVNWWNNISLKDILTGALDSMSNAFESMASGVASFGKSVGDGFIQGAKEAETIINDTTESMADKAKRSVQSVGTAAKEEAKNTYVAVGAIAGSMMDAAKQSIDALAPITIKVTEGIKQTKTATESATVATNASAAATSNAAQELLKKSALDKEAEKFIKANMSAQDKYNATLSQADALLSAGKITQDQYSAAVGKAQAALDKSTASKSRLSEAQKMQNELMKQGASLTQNLLTPQEEYQQSLAKAEELLNAGAINQDTYNRALTDAEQALAKSAEKTEQLKNKKVELTEAQKNEIAVQEKLTGLASELAAAQSNLTALQTGGLDALEANKVLMAAQNELKSKGISLESQLAREYLSSAQSLSEAQQALEDQKKTAESYASVQKDLIGLNQQAADEAKNLTIMQAKGKDALEAHKVVQQATNTLTEKGIDLNSDLAKQYIASTREVADLKKQQDDYNQLLSDGKSVFESVKTEAEKYYDESKKLNDLLKAGAITAETYERAMQKIDEQYDAGAKAAKAYTEESEKLSEKIKVLTAGLGGNEEAARRAELELKNYNAAQIQGIIDDENRIKSLEKTEQGFKDLAEEAKRTSESINQSLTDAFLSGDFKSIGSRLVDIFKNDIAEPILNKVFKPLSDAIGNSFSGIGNSISQSLGGSGTLFGTTGTGSGIMGVLSGGGMSGALMGGGLGMLAGQAFGQTGIGSGIGGALGTFLGAGNPLFTAAGSLLGGLVESLFGGKQDIIANFVSNADGSQRGTQDGWYHTGRDQGQWLNRQGAFGAFGLGEGSQSVGRDDAEQVTALHAWLDQLEQIQSRIASFLSPDEIAAVTARLDGFEGDALNATAVTRSMLVEIFRGMDEDMQRAFQGSENHISGTADEIIARFEYIAQINDAQFVPAMEKMGWNLGNTETKALAAAVGLTDAAGGLTQLQSKLEAYYAAAYTNEERAAIERTAAQTSLDAFNATVGMTGSSAIDSIADLRAYIEAQDATTASGQANINAALDMVSALQTLSSATDQMSDSADSAAVSMASMQAALARYNDVVYTSAQRADMERQQAQAQIEAYSAALNLTGAAVIDTAEELKRHYDALVASGEATDEQLQAALELADAIAIVSGTADDLANASRSAADAAADAANSNNELGRSASSAAGSTNTLASAADTLGRAANDAVYDVAQLQSSISDLVTQLYGNTTVGTGGGGSAAVDNANAALENARNTLDSLRRQYSSEQERVRNLNSAAQSAYRAEVSRINDINSAKDAAHREELSRYNELKSAADSLRQSVEGFADPVNDNAAVLRAAQQDYNKTIAAARAGDLEAVSQLNEAGNRLAEALSENYAGGDRARSGVNQIEAQIKAVADSLDAVAGNEPVNVADISLPAEPGEVYSTLLGSLQSQIDAQQALINSLSSAANSASAAAGRQTATADRQALAAELAGKIGDLGLAQDASVFDLLKANGISLDALAADFGVNVNKLDSTFVTKIAALARQLNVDSLALLNEIDVSLRDVAVSFGIDLDKLDNTFASKVAELANQLKTDSLTLISEMGADLTELANSFGIDIAGLDDGMLSKIDSLADALHVDSVSLASALGGNIDLMGDLIANRLGALPGIPDNIRANLAPYLTAIENANDPSALTTELSKLQTYVNSLPPGIRDQLQAQLDGIVGNTSSTSVAAGATGSAVNSQSPILSAIRSANDNMVPHQWAMRQMLDQQNRNWSQSGKQDIPSFAVGTDALKADGLINAHAGETIFSPSQSASLRDKTIASLSALPEIGRRLNQPNSNVINIKPSPPVSKPDDKELAEEMRKLRESNERMEKELMEFRKESRAVGYQVANNTDKTSKTLKKFDIDGLPEERAA